MTIEIEELKQLKNPSKKTKSVEPETDLSIKWYDLELPSKGKMGYPGTIQYRDVMLRDEKIIATATEKNFQKVINDVLRGLLKNPDYFEKMAIFDRDFLLIYIWANSYGTIKNLTHNCQSCEHENHVVVDLTKMDIKDLDDSYQHPYPVTLSNGTKVKFKLLSVGDEKLTEQHCIIHKNASENYVLLSRSVIFDKVMDMEEKLKYMDETFSGKDMALLRGFHSKFRFGADNSHQYNCKSCGEVNRISVPFSIENLLPTNDTSFG